MKNFMIAVFAALALTVVAEAHHINGNGGFGSGFHNPGINQFRGGFGWGFNSGFGSPFAAPFAPVYPVAPFGGQFAPVYPTYPAPGFGFFRPGFNFGFGFGGRF